MTLGGVEFTERRAAAARARFTKAADVGRFGVGLVVIVLGALMIADSVVGAVTGNPVFFGGVNGGFEFAVGLVSVLVGGAQVPSAK